MSTFKEIIPTLNQRELYDVWKIINMHQPELNSHKIDMTLIKESTKKSIVEHIKFSRSVVLDQRVPEIQRDYFKEYARRKFDIIFKCAMEYQYEEKYTEQKKILYTGIYKRLLKILKKSQKKNYGLYNAKSRINYLEDDHEVDNDNDDPDDDQEVNDDPEDNDDQEDNDDPESQEFQDPDDDPDDLEVPEDPEDLNSDYNSDSEFSESESVITRTKTKEEIFLTKEAYIKIK